MTQLSDLFGGNVQTQYDSYFEQLSISVITRGTSGVSDGKITQIAYSSGNKQVFSYNVDGLVSTVQYYDTNGTTLLATNTFTYDTDNYVATNTWS